MKRRKQLGAMLLAGTLTLMLSGCGNTENKESEESLMPSESVEMTDEQEVLEASSEVEEEVVMTAVLLAEEMAAATEGKQMTQITSAVDMVMSMGMDGITVEMTMNSKSDSVVSLEPYAAYTGTAMTMNVAGEEITESAESYVVVEEENIIYYTYSDSTGQWNRLDMDMSLEDVTSMYTGYDWMKDTLPADLVLEEGTQTLEDREVYKLSCTLTGEQMQMALGGMSGMEDLLKESGLEAMDFTLLTVPTTFYVDAETYLPLQMEIDIEGLDQMIADLVAESVEGAGMDMEINISKLQGIYSNISYEPVEVPAVPEEAYTSVSQESFNPD